MSDEIAPKGTRFVCLACGKTSSTRYGFDGTADRGWDPSCMMNAVLCRPSTSRERLMDGLPWHAITDESSIPEEEPPPAA